MKTIKVKIKVITFVHKDTGKTESFVFANNHDESDSFEGEIFGETFNVTGFWKVSSHMKREGHREVATEKEVEIPINLEA